MLQIITGILIFVGLFFVTSDLFRIPYLKTSKAITHLSKRQKKKIGSIELWLKDLGVWLSKRLKINNTNECSF